MADDLVTISMCEGRIAQLIAILARAQALGDNQATGFLMVFVAILHEYYRGKELPE